MTPKEKLEHEIKVLEEAREILGWNNSHIIHLNIEALKKQLKALETLEIWEGCLVEVWEYDTYKGIRTYKDFKLFESVNSDLRCTQLPYEKIIEHLAGYVKRAVRWECGGSDYVHLIVEGEHGRNYDFTIPAPYRDDWEGIGGEL